MTGGDDALKPRVEGGRVLAPARVRKGARGTLAGRQAPAWVFHPGRRSTPLSSTALRARGDSPKVVKTGGVKDIRSFLDEECPVRQSVAMMF